MPRVSGDVLVPGRVLSLASEADPGLVCTVTVAGVKHGLIWVSGFEKREQLGERVIMECWVPDDALYRAQGKIEFVPPESWTLRRSGEWERVQRREHLRITVWQHVDVELTQDTDETGIGSFPLMDISTGGARFATSGAAAEALKRGMLVRCRFSIPEVGDFEARAQVVRSLAPESALSPGSAAIRFLKLDLEDEAAIARWVQSEQMRRAH
jgi:hypothetical protein